MCSIANYMQTVSLRIPPLHSEVTQWKPKHRFNNAALEACTQKHKRNIRLPRSRHAEET